MPMNIDQQLQSVDIALSEANMSDSEKEGYRAAAKNYVEAAAEAKRLENEMNAFIMVYFDLAMNAGDIEEATKLFKSVPQSVTKAIMADTLRQAKKTQE